MTTRKTYHSDLGTAIKSRNEEWQSDVSLDASFVAVELAGEVGEVCNVVKKLERERLGLRGSRETVEHLREELGDVLICLHLLAQKYDIDLDASAAAKFNMTSNKVGLSHYMGPPLRDRG